MAKIVSAVSKFVGRSKKNVEGRSAVSESECYHPMLGTDEIEPNSSSIDRAKQRNESAPNRILDPIFMYSPMLRKLNRKKNRRNMLIVGTTITDVISIIIAFAMASFIRLGYSDNEQLINICITIIPIHIAIGLNNRAFQAKILTELWTNVSRGLVSFLLASGSMLLILFFFKTSEDFSRLMFGLGTLGAATLLVVCRALVYKMGQSLLNGVPYADLCIYDSVAYKGSKPDSVVDVRQLGLVADSNDITAVNQLGDLASGLDRIVIHCQPEKRASWVSMLRTLDIQSEIVVPELDAVAPLKVMKRNGRTSLLISSGQLRWDQKTIKRIFDIVVVLVSLPIVLSVMCVIALAIKLDSKGPVFFTQARIGLGNRPFKIWKFRSMKTESSDMVGARSTARDDDRITRVGRFIRSTSIDELPQIFNVLAGSMSIIGPRPHAPGSRAENSLFWDIDQRYWQRHVVKPGLTGLAQIRGYRGATEREVDLSNRLQSDLEYVAKWSLWNDIKIFLKTFSVLLHKNAF